MTSSKHLVTVSRRGLRLVDQVPQMLWIAEHSRDNKSVLLSQARVVE